MRGFASLALLAPFALGSCAEDPCAAGPGTVCTWAGTGEAAFGGDGDARDGSPLYWPVKVRFGPDGRGYILDWNNHRVRRVAADGTVQTVLGTPTIGDGPDTGDETLPPGVPGTSVNLNHPTDLAFLPDGTALLAAWHNHKLRAWDPASGMAYVACGSVPGFRGDGSAAHDALLDQPRSLAVGLTGDVYIADQRNQRIRRVAAADQIISTVAGNGVKGFGGDGASPREAQFSFPSGGNPLPGGAVALDGEGRLYVADTQNHRIRRVDLVQDRIETIAGTGEQGFSGDDGPASAAALHTPRDLDVAGGFLYVADTENDRIRRIDLASGIITTVAPDAAELSKPFGVTVGPDGALYVADTFNHRIRRVDMESR